MKLTIALALAFVVGSVNYFSHAARADQGSQDQTITATDNSDAGTGESIDFDHPGHGGGHPGFPGHPGMPGHPGFPHGPGHHDPFPVHHGGYPWPHWGHPPFARPVYVWNWAYLHAVTCTAADSEGGLYPVTEDGYGGIEYQEQLPAIEDAAIDRCYNETGGDTGCHLVDCTPGY